MDMSIGIMCNIRTRHTYFKVGWTYKTIVTLCLLCGGRMVIVTVRCAEARSQRRTQATV